MLLFSSPKQCRSTQVLYLPPFRATVVLLSITTLVWAQTTSSPAPVDGTSLYYLIGTGLIGALGTLGAVVKILFTETKALNTRLLAQAEQHGEEIWKRIIPLLEANKNICLRLDVLTEAVERIAPQPKRSTK